MDDYTVPQATCPQCGAMVDDHDGFGVLHCHRCGYCAHPEYLDELCTICGEQYECKK